LKIKYFTYSHIQQTIPTCFGIFVQPSLGNIVIQRIYEDEI